jgi:hypothetical protein
MTPETIQCAYCGNRHTEWDHLRAIISGQEPTGFITEIANLVPSCGKCNQSKGSTNWKMWMLGDARLSPKTRGIKDLSERVSRLEAYEQWQTPKKFDFQSIAGQELWSDHIQNWRNVLEPLKKSQERANEIRVKVAAASK